MRGSMASAKSVCAARVLAKRCPSTSLIQAGGPASCRGRDERGAVFDGGCVAAVWQADFDPVRSVLGG